MTNNNDEINKALNNTNSARGVLTFCEWSSGEFDVTNNVTALHRLAKAPDRRFVRGDSRYGSVIGNAHVAVVNTCGNKEAWPQLSKEHLMNALWSFSILEHRDDYLFDCICKDALEKAEGLLPQDMACMTRAMANLRIQNEQVMDKLLSMSRKRINQFRSSHLANLVWSFATLALKDDAIMDVIAKEAISKIRYFLPNQLTQMSWAYATLEIKNAALSGAMTDAMIGRVEEFHPKDVAKIAWSFAKLSAGTEAVMEVIAESASIKLNELDPECLEWMAYSFATSDLKNEELFSSLMAEVLNRMDELTAQNLAVIAWSFASLKITDETFLGSLRSEISTRGADFRASDLAKLIEAFVLWGKKDEAFGPLFEIAMTRISKFNPKDLSTVALAIDAVGDTELMTKYLHEAAWRFTKVSEHAMAPNWFVFANMVTNYADAPTKRDFLAQFKEAMYKPLIILLHALSQPPRPPMKSRAFGSLQDFVKSTQLEALGPIYTREALLALYIGVLSRHTVSMDELREIAGPPLGTWDLSRSVSAVSWDLEWADELWVEPIGRIFSTPPSGKGAATGKRKMSLSSFPQLEGHKMQAERLALTHLAIGVLRKVQEASHLNQCVGDVRIKSSQFLSIDSMAMLCQFRHFFPFVRMEVEFDVPQVYLQ